MIFPTLTAVYGAILGLIHAVISSWVIAGRFKFDVLHGDGGSLPMNRRMRAHANFAEYVPMILLLVGLLEAGGGGSAVAVHGLLLALVVTRVLHPIGMVAPEKSLQQYVCRGASAAATLIVMTVAAVLLLVRFA